MHHFPDASNDRSHFLAARRNFLARTACGFGGIAAASLLGSASSNAASADRAAEGLPILGGGHFPAKAKRVIYLFMSGGPSQLDLWDYKPKMPEMFGQSLPDHIRDGQRITGMTAGQKTLPLCPSKYKFTQHDNNDRGVWVSEAIFGKTPPPPPAIAECEEPSTRRPRGP